LSKFHHASVRLLRVQANFWFSSIPIDTTK